jgi:hypothetical protein
MVRAIAGTLMQVGRGYWPAERVAEILEAGDRRLAGPTALAAGLFLVRVTYPDRLVLPFDPGAEVGVVPAAADPGAFEPHDESGGAEADVRVG